MIKQSRYSIGDISNLCHISKKALRYYDKIGLFKSQRQDFNNYRYYTKESLLTIPVIKFYKQMGFTLDEMKVFIEGKGENPYPFVQHSFLRKICELQGEQDRLQNRIDSVKDWYALTLEAQQVIEHNFLDVSLKYIDKADCLFMNQPFDADNRSAIINLDFTNYVEMLGYEITGPVMIHFPQANLRVAEEEQQVTILQKTLSPCAPDVRFSFGGFMAACSYHIGAYDNIGQSYKRIKSWLKRKNCNVSGASYERYVIDYWTTEDTAYFVTEIIFPIISPLEKNK